METSKEAANCHLPPLVAGEAGNRTSGIFEVTTIGDQSRVIMNHDVFVRIYPV